LGSEFHFLSCVHHNLLKKGVIHSAPLSPTSPHPHHGRIINLLLVLTLDLLKQFVRHAHSSLELVILIKMKQMSKSDVSVVLESSVKPSQCCQSGIIAWFARRFKNHGLRPVGAEET